MRASHAVRNAHARCAGGLIRRFRSDDSGVTAVEFALVAPLFFLLLFSIIEVALMSFSNSTLHTGLAGAARLVRTGQAQCLTDEQFIEAICENAGFAPNCSSRTEVERRVFTAGFSDPSLTIDADEFSTLSGGDVVMISAIYKWPLQSPLVEPFFSNGEGDAPFRMSLLFKNEEFKSTGCAS